MNELQKVEFDLFLCFDSICKKLNLDYFLLSGSALGAVRHGGFIPWDDDLDVGMYREDYDKFIELAPKLLPKELFLQNYNSDSKAPFLYSKLRNSNTTFIEKSISKFDINHGIFIDIFPLDGYTESKIRQKYITIFTKIYRWKTLCGIDMKFKLKSKVLVTLLRFLKYHKRTAKTLTKYEAFVSKYPVEKSKIICSHGNHYGKCDYMPKEIYGKGTYVSFEGVSVRVPEKYEEYLTRLYDDWRTPPPAKECREIHLCEVVDTKKSYKEYI